MGGSYVTQSRKVQPWPTGLKAVVTRLSPAEGPWTASQATIASVLPQPSQTTTSWRTSSSGNSHDLEEDELLGATSSIDLRKSIKKQHKRRGTSDRSYDTGHTFDTQRSGYVDPIRQVNINCSSGVYSGTWNYTGIIRPVPGFVMAGGGYYPALDPVGSTTWYETTAINRTLPAQPVAGLATTLGELRRDGLPSLFGSELLRNRTKDLRSSVGSEYLNVEFAWKPLISDLSKTLLAVNQAGSLWRQYQRDSGRIVRRSYVFPESITTTSSTSSSTALVHDLTGMITDAKLLVGTQVLKQTLTKRRNVWFKAGYSYYLPNHDESSQVGKLYAYEEKVNHLLGTRLTPEVVWNLQPWSWLADWNANIGTNISNATALGQNGLVIRYGYLMIEDSVTWDWTLQGVTFRGQPTLQPVSGSSYTIRKKRIKASPFGFGLNPNSFTGRQWAILAALGMTKGPTTLRQE